MWFDPAIIDALVDVVPPWLAVLLALLSFLGSAVFLTPLVVGWFTIRPGERVLALAGILFCSYVVRDFLKALNEIERPMAEPDFDPSRLPFFLELVYVHPVGIDTTGFPSGHMVAGIVFWGLLAVDLSWGNQRSRIVAAIGILLIIGLSRILLGAHWIEDVIVGAVVGTALLLGYLWGRSRTNGEVVFAFGLAGVAAAIDLMVAGTLSGQATFAVSWGVFLGLALQARTGWPKTSPLSPISGLMPVLGTVTGGVLLAIMIVVNPPSVPSLLAITPAVALGIHWHLGRIASLPLMRPLAERR